MVDIRDYDGAWPDEGMDLEDMIVHMCPCGSNLFKIIASFDDYEIATYSTDGECLECGTRFKVPTPIDKPGYKPDSLV